MVGLDARKVPACPARPSGYEIVIHGGRTPTGLDALDWAKRCEALGAGELCLNSIDADGTRNGYDLAFTRLIADNVTIPVIASGGAGHPGHLAEAVTAGGASAALIASIVHFGKYTIAELKSVLQQAGVSVRLT